MRINGDESMQDFSTAHGPGVDSTSVQVISEMPVHPDLDSAND